MEVMKRTRETIHYFSDILHCIIIGSHRFQTVVIRIAPLISNASLPPMVRDGSNKHVVSK